MVLPLVQTHHLQADLAVLFPDLHFVRGHFRGVMTEAVGVPAELMVNAVLEPFLKGHERSLVN